MFVWGEQWGACVLTLLFLSGVGCCCWCWLLLLVLSLPPWSLWSLQVQSVMTARQLLSILRLSQALARLRFSRRVELEDVEEAIRLVHMCKASLLEDDTFTVRSLRLNDRYLTQSNILIPLDFSLFSETGRGPHHPHLFLDPGLRHCPWQELRELRGDRTHVVDQRIHAR